MVQSCSPHRTCCRSRFALSPRPAARIVVVGVRRRSARRHGRARRDTTEGDTPCWGDRHRTAAASAARPPRWSGVVALVRHSPRARCCPAARSGGPIADADGVVHCPRRPRRAYTAQIHSASTSSEAPPFFSTAGAKQQRQSRGLQEPTDTHRRPRSPPRSTACPRVPGDGRELPRRTSAVPAAVNAHTDPARHGRACRHPRAAYPSRSCPHHPGGRHTVDRGLRRQ